MNPELSRAFVSHHIRDIRREAALAAGPAELTASSTRSAPGQTPGQTRAQTRGQTLAAGPQLRSRIGFALVEAGLRLLADRSVTVRPGLD